MITPQDCFDKYGTPSPDFERKWMGLYTVPDDIHQSILPLPKKIYCNKDFWSPFINGMKLVVERGLAEEINEWGGIFNIRLMRGSNQWSIHSWAVAFDINPSTNKMYDAPSMSKELVVCFKENGFDWGGDWVNRMDGMHFQLNKIA